MKYLPQINAILYLHTSHNTPLLPPKDLHRHRFGFRSGHHQVPGEIANKDYAKFWQNLGIVLDFSGHHQVPGEIANKDYAKFWQNLGIVLDFSRDIIKSQEKLQTKIMQNFGGKRGVLWEFVQEEN